MTEASKTEKEYTVLYDFVAEQETDLALQCGETITVTSEADVWWHGRNSDGQEGYFPSNYVAPKKPTLPPRANKDRALPAPPAPAAAAAQAASSAPSANNAGSGSGSDSDSGSEEDNDIVLAPPAPASAGGGDAEAGSTRPMSVYGTPLEVGGACHVCVVCCVLCVAYCVLCVCVMVRCGALVCDFCHAVMQ